MLGLRPGLKARPSLLDLIRKPDIDQISTSADSSPTLDTDVDPQRVPLPASPALTPQRKDSNQLPPSTLRIKLHEASDDEEQDTRAAKMPAVSFCPNRRHDGA